MSPADFDWATSNLEVESPQELQGRGVNVYFAPNIAPETKVINLRDGSVDSFFEGEERPSDGYYAEFDSLERYCDRRGSRLVETNGQASAQQVEEGRAG